MLNFSEAARSLLASAEAERMRGRPEYQKWGEDLLALSNDQRICAVAGVCREIATTGLTSLEPIQRFLTNQATSISTADYLLASEVAEAAIDKSPHAGFLLSLVVMLGWSTSLGRRLYAHDSRGSPNVGWIRIPYTCALACLRLDDLAGARILAEEGYQVLMAAWQAPWPKAEEHLEAHIRILAKILRKHEFGTGNLAADLRDSCRPGQNHFRSEIGAILWTLGLVPESYSFMRTSKDSLIPSLRFFRKVVRQSIALIPTDNLLQYVWLQLKDRPPFNIRDHGSLFPIINRRYDEWMWVSGCPINPCEAYAKSLIALIRGDLTEQHAAEFLKAQEWIQDTLYPDHLNLLDYIRMTSLANVIGLSMGWAKKEVSEERVNEHWYALVDLACRMRLNYVLHPEWPEIYSRADMCLFHVIESALGKPPGNSESDRAKAEIVIRGIENVRSAALDYWLKVAPPRLMDKEETEEVYRMRPREVELVHDLRGSYFQMLYPILPEHYHHPHVQGIGVPGIAFTSGPPPSQLVVPPTKAIDPEEGREVYRRISDELTALYKQMQQYAPEYCKKRLNPTATLQNIVRVINAHGSGFKPLEGEH
jgi:hypothetical protein